MRIVSLLPSATETICALGLDGGLVGVTHEEAASRDGFCFVDLAVEEPWLRESVALSSEGTADAGRNPTGRLEPPAGSA